LDIIACSKKWFPVFSNQQGFPLDDFVLITHKDELDEALITQHNPDYVFFPHWNWRVPNNIHSRVEAIAFHIAPLPEGRGGSPIQNLILSGVETAPLNSLRMIEEVDAGPIYFSDEIDLSGTLDEILWRATGLIWKQLALIRETHPTPRPQKGLASYFRRLNPSENEIAHDDGFEKIWDKLRMVEGEGYPDAFIQLSTSTLIFREVSRTGKKISGRFTIIPRDNGSALG